MAITSVDDIAAALASAQHRLLMKNFGAPKAAGAFQSGWLATGNPVAGAAAPAYTAGSGYACDKSTTGALPYVNGATQNYLAKFGPISTQVGSVVLLDRLWSCSGMGFTAGTYTVSTPGNLPARITDNGLAAELWVENFVAAGAASGTLTANYVDSTGASVSGQIAAVVSAPVAGQLQPVPLANNLGVKQLTSAVTSATWTSGSFGMLIAQRIAELPIAQANAPQNVADWAACALAKIPPDACLMLAFLANGTTAPVITGSIDIIDK